jgi:hypothetical protein
MPESLLVKLDNYIEPVSTEYFMKPPISLCLCVSPWKLLGNCSASTFPRQRIHNNRSIVRLVVFYTTRVISKDNVIAELVLAAMKNCLKPRFPCGPCRVKGESVCVC